MFVHYLIIQISDHLESVHDEADEVGEDGEQVHHVQGRRHELELAGGTEEPHRVLWARVRINGLDNLDMQVCRYHTGDLHVCCVGLTPATYLPIVKNHIMNSSMIFNTNTP